MPDFKDVATTSAHNLEKPLEFAEKACKVIDTVVQARPELKKVLTDLVAKSEALGAEASQDVADCGASITLDFKTGADLLAYVAWIRSALVPVVLDVYGDIEADVTA